MTEYLILMKVFMLLYTLMSASVILHTEGCFNTEDKLWVANGYRAYLSDNNSFYKFVDAKESCVFENTTVHYYNSINVTNISNGTFVPFYEPEKILCAAHKPNFNGAC